MRNRSIIPSCRFLLASQRISFRIQVFILPSFHEKKAKLFFKFASFRKDLLFPPSKTKFQNQPAARRLYNKMIEAMRKAKTLSYEAVDGKLWFEFVKEDKDWIQIPHVCSKI